MDMEGKSTITAVEIQDNPTKWHSMVYMAHCDYAYVDSGEVTKEGPSVIS